MRNWGWRWRRRKRIPMRHLDLFSGIGGFALAARWVGWETVGFCEIDPYCQKVLRKHWPDVPIHEDVKCLSLPEGSLARTFQLRINRQRAYRENGQGSGQSNSDSFASYDRSTRLWKMSQLSLPGVLTESSVIWPRSGTMRNGIAYQLPPLAASRTETGYGLLPTLPASETKDFSQAKVLSRLDKGGRVARRICRKSSLIHSEEIVGLNPSFAEAITGLPIGWTELEDSETLSSLRSQK